jgi:hypothetical protein
MNDIHPRFAERRAKIEFDRQGVPNIVTIEVTLYPGNQYLEAPGMIVSEEAISRKPRLAALETGHDWLTLALGLVLAGICWGFVFAIYYFVRWLRG